MDDQGWLKLLTSKLSNSRDDLLLLDDYYRGEQPLSFMSPAMVAEFGERVRALIFGWPQLVVDSIEERLDVEGFRLSDTGEADEELWRIWQANNADETSQMGILDSLIAGRSFAIVGSNPDDKATPRISIESAQQVAASWDPQTRTVRAAVKTWKDPETKESFATLYLPHVTIWFKRARQNSGAWVEQDRDTHELGEVPVVPLVNRPRTMRPDGDSEITPTLRSITDAVNKTGTDMMTSMEFHAMPRRWVTGMEESDFTDEQGRATASAWSSIAGRIWSSSNTDTKIGQFAEADLRNFHESIKALAEQLAALGCLPPHYLGLLSQNPASADAIRSAEARLVKRVERKQRALGGSFEMVMRLARRIATGENDPTMAGLETIWADASTPTIAQKADAVVKLHAEGLVSTEQAQEDIGYSATQIERMRGQLDAQQARKDASLAGLLATPVDTTPASPA